MLNREELEKIYAGHEPWSQDSKQDVCDWCDTAWPCEVAKLRGHIEGLEALLRQTEEALAALQSMLAEHDSLGLWAICPRFFYYERGKYIEPLLKAIREHPGEDQ